MLQHCVRNKTGERLYRGTLNYYCYRYLYRFNGSELLLLSNMTYDIFTVLTEVLTPSLTVRLSKPVKSFLNDLLWFQVIE